MPKRKRTRLRSDQFYALAITAHQQNWSRSRIEQELDILIAKNYDLEDIKAQTTARDEFWSMASPSLNGWLPKVRELAEEAWSREPAGTTKRFNHLMISFCRKAIKHSGGPSAALKEVENDLAGH